MSFTPWVYSLLYFSTLFSSHYYVAMYVFLVDDCTYAYGLFCVCQSKKKNHEYVSFQFEIFFFQRSMALLF